VTILVAGDVQWGTVGEWAAAVLAGILIAVTLYLWRHEHTGRQRDEARREAEARTRRSRMVAAWLNRTEPDHYDPKLIVLNAGPEVITDWSTSFCIVLACSPDGPPHEHKWANAMSNRVDGALVPGVPRTMKITNLASGPVVEVTFIDPAGERWQRIGNEVHPI
jgi:hypothetical protein